MPVARRSARSHAREVRLDLRGVSMTIEGSFGTLRAARRSCSAASTPRTSLVVLGCLLALGVPLAEAAAALAAVHGAARPHGGDRAARARQAAGRGRLRAHPGRARQGAWRAARALPRRAVVRVRLRRRPRSPASGRSWAPSPTSSPIEIIVTDDNPRSEDPQDIIRGITRRHQVARARG